MSEDKVIHVEKIELTDEQRRGLTTTAKSLPEARMSERERIAEIVNALIETHEVKADQASTRGEIIAQRYAAAVLRVVNTYIASGKTLAEMLAEWSSND